MSHAVTIAAPDHWHALMTIWACQAGKDVYVEKPVSHNIVEGRRMIEAARRYNRVVAVGTQRRSGAVLGEGGSVPPRRRARQRSTRERPSSIASGIRSASRRTARCRRACITTCGSGPRPRVRSTRTTSITTGTGSGNTAPAISATPACIRWTRCAGCLANRSIPARRTPSAVCTRKARRPIRSPRTRSRRHFSMRMAHSSTAKSATGPAARPRPRASTSSAPRAG